VDVGTLLVANSQSAKLVEPSKASLYHPPPAPRSTAMIGTSLREPRHDATDTPNLPSFEAPVQSWGSMPIPSLTAEPRSIAAAFNHSCNSHFSRPGTGTVRACPALPTKSTVA
jgi:hypothetical protein